MHGHAKVMPFIIRTLPKNLILKLPLRIAGILIVGFLATIGKKE